MAYRALNDAEWEAIAWLLPEQSKRGRHRRPERDVLDAILYVLSSGCHWADLPAYFPPKSTVHRRFQQLEKAGFFKRAFQYLRSHLPESTRFHLDTTLKPAKKGDKNGWAHWCKSSKISLVVNQQGLPVFLALFPGNRGDVKTIGSLLSLLPQGSELTADKAYDIPWFRIKLLYLGFQTNIPHRATWFEHRQERVPGKPPENPLTYQQRWKVERCFAWFSHFRRLNIRWERYARLYLAFWLLAATRILLSHILG